MPPKVYAGGALTAAPGRPASHHLISPDPAGWSQVALIEWELRGQAWSDTHPHDEYNYVLDGVLLVSCDGETVEVPAGSAVKVPAGTTGRYWAPEHARMLAIYGPNSGGETSTAHGLTPLDDRPARPGPRAQGVAGNESG